MLRLCIAIISLAAREQKILGNISLCQDGLCSAKTLGKSSHPQAMGNNSTEKNQKCPL